MEARGLLGKVVVGIVTSPDFDDGCGRKTTSIEGLILRDRRGRETVVRFVTLESDDGGEYGYDFVWPAREPNAEHERVIRWREGPK